MRQDASWQHVHVIVLPARQVLLGRYARAEDVVVGTPLANRSRSELEGLIGYFVNSVALRADLSGACLSIVHVPGLLAFALGSSSHRPPACKRLQPSQVRWCIEAALASLYDRD